MSAPKHRPPVGRRVPNWGASPGVASAAYETGWEEGWTACLAAVQSKGLAEALAVEARLEAPSQIPLDGVGANGAGVPTSPVDGAR